LRAYGLPISRVVDAVRSGNSDAGGRVLEFGGAEYMVAGWGTRARPPISRTSRSVRAAGGTPVRVKDVADVVLGPEVRRGVTDLDGAGEAVSGIIIMRQGENALDVIGRVKASCARSRPDCPTA